jgi:lipid kinase YegS
MASHTCLVLHRKSANRPEIKQAVKHVRGQGIKLRVRIPWNKRDKPRVVREALASGATRIIAGGGDGTINAVANALIGKGKKKPEATLGVLPLGTANDFAHGCGLPVEDLDKCLEIACTAEAQKIDVGRANSRFFINVTSGGFGAEITATTPIEMKERLGGAAYTLQGLIKVFNLKPYEGQLLVPGEEPLEGSMLVMAVGNNRLAGGGFEVAPKARLDDGLLDLAVVRHPEGVALTRLAKELETPDDPNNQILYYRQLREFTLVSSRDVHFNLDGEPTREKKITFSVLPKHLGVAF